MILYFHPSGISNENHCYAYKVSIGRAGDYCLSLNIFVRN